MRTCVVGAGSVGGYLAARLARAGRDVAVVARGAHLDAIRRDGLTLETPEERFTVRPPAAADASELGERDLYLVAVKHPSLGEVAAMLAPLLRPATTVVFAMNGVFWFYGHGFRPQGRGLPVERVDPGGAVARAVGAERAVGCVVYSPNEVTAPGVVRNEGKAGRFGNRFILGGAVPGSPGRARAAAEALDGCGFAVEAVPEVRSPMWAKLAFNLSSAPLCALLGGTGAGIVADPGTRALAEALFREALAVAAAHGFALPDLDPVGATAPGSRPTHKPSMLQDLERGRPIEADAMVAAVQDLARDAGVRTPVLDVVLPLLRARAAAAAAR